MSLPNFFIPGAGRSGTTSLAGALSRHPDVFIPKMKEPSFFSESFQWVKTPSRYAELYAEAHEPLRGDASHVYLEDPVSAATIKAFCPDAKFVIVLRNPADRALGLYAYMVEHGYEIHSTFEQALKAEDRRFHSERFRRRRWGPFWNFMYFRSGLYAEQIERYLEHFPRERLFVTTLPQLITQPFEVVNEMCAFLGVAPLNLETFPRDGTSKGVKSTKLQVLDQRLLKPLEYRRVPGVGTSRASVNRWNRMPRPSMQAETHADLMRRFEPDLHRLRELVGIDLLSDGPPEPS